jgi:hypothetical protein
MEKIDMTSEQRINVLDQLRNGEISADEAEKLLADLGNTPATEGNPDDHRVVILPKGEHQGITQDANIPQYDSFWKYIFGVGTGIFFVFGLLLTSITGFLALLCFGPFVLAGFGIAAIGLWSRSSHWIHVRVQDRDGTNIKFSLPFPIGLASWTLRLLNPYLRARTGYADLSGLDLAAFIDAMGDELSPENPIMVAVDDDDDQVLVYIT